ncbi:cysteine desulfurase IscS [Planctomycetota bacterium]|jgi:cysteine desulfurase|nr:IscS subfamily cysteine desulfurase [Planctomycetota bacterium]MSR37252.1 IscS subfamily cysteine desulfurase [Planctomycetota bacterium]GDY01165.1 cysteine desulfurase IscS [Planctomycetota bacterium]
MKTPIYMDYSATTPCDPRVVQRMLPFFTETFGNSASRSHAFGWTAEAAVDHAREQVAALIGAHPKEILWTSGSTEANNLAIKGVAQMYRQKGNHLITAVTEHKAVLDPMKYLETQGFEVTFLPVNRLGHVDLEQLAFAMTDRTILVSLMAANNEIGTLHPLAKIGALCKQKGVLFHTDATQAPGKIELDVESQHIDLLSLSAHKLYGPKGVGCLYVRRKNPRVRLVSQMDGGGHERGMRSGTLNITGIVGMGEAAAIAKTELHSEVQKLLGLRARLQMRIMNSLPDSVVNGDQDARLPHLTNISFPYVEGESLIMGIKEIAVSSGSACTSASLEPSYVLKGLGLGDELAHSSIRFSLGRFTTEAEVDFAADRVIAEVNRLRAMSPLWEMVQEGIDLSQVKWTSH